jgi:hypothetical protein
MAEQFINAWGQGFDAVVGATAKSIPNTIAVSPAILHGMVASQSRPKAFSFSVPPNVTQTSMPNIWQAAAAAPQPAAHVRHTVPAAQAASTAQFAKVEPPRTDRPKSPTKAPPPAASPAAASVSASTAAKAAPAATPAAASAKASTDAKAPPAKRTRPRGGKHKDLLSLANCLFFISDSFTCVTDSHSRRTTGRLITPTASRAFHMLSLSVWLLSHSGTTGDTRSAVKNIEIKT